MPEGATLSTSCTGVSVVFWRVGLGLRLVNRPSSLPSQLVALPPMTREMRLAFSSESLSPPYQERLAFRMEKVDPPPPCFRSAKIFFWRGTFDLRLWFIWPDTNFGTRGDWKESNEKLKKLVHRCISYIIRCTMKCVQKSSVVDGATDVRQRGLK